MKKITEEDLKNDAALMKHFRGAAERDFIPDSEAGLITYFAAAQHCLDHADCPVALFVRMITSGLGIETISDESEDRAIRRLKKMRGDALNAGREETEELSFQHLQVEVEERIRRWKRNSRLDPASAWKREVEF